MFLVRLCCGATYLGAVGAVIAVSFTLPIPLGLLALDRALRDPSS